MRRWIFSIAVLVACASAIGLAFAFSAAASAPAAGAEGAEVGAVVQLLQNHQWRPAVAALLTLLMFFWRRYGGVLVIKWIPASHLGWVTALVGFVATLPAHLTAPTFSWGAFVLDGLITGGEAGLFWSTLGRQMLPRLFGEIPEKK